MQPLAPDDPTRLGPFHVEARLGAGGMGQVYLARDENGRTAAVKVIHPHLASDPQFRARFAREIDTARRVHTPWTAAVLAADPHGLRPWLATEFIEGPPLDQVVTATGPLPDAAVRLLAHHLARALEALHAAGVVHRDLKPSNVLLAHDGPRLIDFGIARAIDSTTITHTGHTLGTPAYMSPEQALGNDAHTPSDVFSLAAVLTYAATTTPPFGHTANPIAMLRRIAVDPPALDGLSPAVRALVEPCLAKDPAARPTAAELAGRTADAAAAGGRLPWVDVRPRFLPGETAPVQGIPGAGRGRRVGRITAVAAVVVLGLAAVGTGVALARRGADEPAGPDVVAIAAPATTTAAPVPTTPPPPPTQVVTGGIVPSTVAGWLAAVSTTRNAAYDVPSPWRPGSPGAIRGYEDEAGNRALMSGVATYESDTLTCPNPDDNPYVLAWSGVTGATGTDTAAAARDVARLWSGFLGPDGAPDPRVRVGGVRPVDTAGGRGSHVVAEVSTAQPECGTPNMAVHAVAVPANRGESVVWVLIAERDVPGAVTDADVDGIIATLRPAGLEASCDPDQDALGSWC